MKKTAAVILLASALAAYPAEQKSHRPAGVPESATEVGKGGWRAVDANGKAWIYRPTPFGLSKIAEDDEKAALAARPAIKTNNVTAEETGEVIRFTRPMPFGVSHWTRKKSEKLTAEETAALEEARQKSIAATQGQK